MSDAVADPAITGAQALAVDPQSGPLLLAGNTLLFHDRAGVSTKQVPLSALGISQLEPPLAFDGAGALLALGRLNGDSAGPAGGNVLQLLRCELAVSTCQHFSPELKDSGISAFVIHPLDGSLLLADSSMGQLLKVNREGKIVARATAPVPESSGAATAWRIIIDEQCRRPGHQRAALRGYRFRPTTGRNPVAASRCAKGRSIQSWEFSLVWQLVVGEPAKSGIRQYRTVSF